MIPVNVIRGVVLAMAVLALLTATVLDGVLMQYMLQPMIRYGERIRGSRVTLDPPMAFLIEHRWARSLYHLTFAVLLFGAWWYLGTAAGAAHWARMIAPHR